MKKQVGTTKGTSKRNRKSNDDPSKWILKLYVAGQTPKCVQALINLRKICGEELQGQYKIKVIDLLKNPKLGRDDQIFAIPTLVRKLPVPMRKIIGDLSNKERVLIGLELREKIVDNSD